MFEWKKENHFTGKHNLYTYDHDRCCQRLDKGEHSGKFKMSLDWECSCLQVISITAKKKMYVTDW